MWVRSPPRALLLVESRPPRKAGPIVTLTPGPAAHSQVWRLCLAGAIPAILMGLQDTVVPTSLSDGIGGWQEPGTGVGVSEKRKPIPAHTAD
jgi:hypothetical protein